MHWYSTHLNFTHLSIVIWCLRWRISWLRVVWWEETCMCTMYCASCRMFVHSWRRWQKASIQNIRATLETTDRSFRTTSALPRKWRHSVRPTNAWGYKPHRISYDKRWSFIFRRWRHLWDFEGALCLDDSLNFDGDGQPRYFGVTSGRLEFESRMESSYDHYLSAFS